jgi:hypothetical protein
MESTNPLLLYSCTTIESPGSVQRTYILQCPSGRQKQGELHARSFFYPDSPPLRSTSTCTMMYDWQPSYPRSEISHSKSPPCSPDRRVAFVLSSLSRPCMQVSSLSSITLCRSDVIPLGDMRSSLNGAENNVRRVWTLGERGEGKVRGV